MPARQGTLDGYVRVLASDLDALELRHLLSEKDLSIAVLHDARAGEDTVTGYTEWVGSWNDRVVSLGWDWGVIRGAVCVVNPGEIRTNILLVAQNQRPEPKSFARSLLLRRIDAIVWQPVIESLLAGHQGLYQ